ncbi:MAG: hypothetical protein J5865_07020 [Lachnospiraceae bacterium]|nr:hypothetical protein [Lachnospiraceae bacterium]
MNKKKSLSEKLRDLTYMQVAMTLFAFAAALLVLCLVLAFVQLGSVGWIGGLAGIVAALLSLIGMIITLYGHFAVGMEGKTKWFWGLILNGAVFAACAALYVIGLVT